MNEGVATASAWSDLPVRVKAREDIHLQKLMPTSKSL
jgi:hypothetical protein